MVAARPRPRPNGGDGDPWARQHVIDPHDRWNDRLDLGPGHVEGMTPRCGSIHHPLVKDLMEPTTAPGGVEVPDEEQPLRPPLAEEVGHGTELVLPFDEGDRQWCDGVQYPQGERSAGQLECGLHDEGPTEEIDDACGRQGIGRGYEERKRIVTRDVEAIGQASESSATTATPSKLTRSG